MADDAHALKNSALHHCCKNGHLDVAEWLVSTFPLTADDVREMDIHLAVQSRRESGDLEFINWMADTFHISLDSK